MPREVEQSTVLDVPADLAWNAVKHIDTFAYVARGPNGDQGLEFFPSPLRPGTDVTLRLLLPGILPAWRHRLRIERIHDARRELQSREDGGPIRRWDHLIRFEVLEGSTCRDTDRVDLDAGSLTPLVWVYAQVFYRHRQARWHLLVRRLTAGHGVPPLARTAREL